jgi:DNA polymerase III subunit beta
VKFRCERDVLAEALGAAGRAVSSRGTAALPGVLSGVRVEVTGDLLTVTGTDLELTIQVTAPVASSVDGVAVVPARLASDIVRSLAPGAVQVDITDDEATFTSGRSRFGVRTLSADDFPKLAPAVGDAVTIEAAAFADALRQVVRAASTDESRPILTGVLLTAEDDGLRLVATDSYRLAVRDLPGTSVLAADQRVLVPSKALQELVRLLGGGGELSVRLGEREASFDVGGSRLTTRLIEGEFPNYRQLIPKGYPNRLVVGREPLLDAIKRVKLLARESSPIRLTLSADGLELTAVTQDVGQASESLDARYDGGELTVAFNPEYLSAGVEAVQSDEIILETLDPMKPAVVRPGQDEGSFLYLLMPVRV